jgi:uncharacterized YigZ family protein
MPAGHPEAFQEKPTRETREMNRDQFPDSYLTLGRETRAEIKVQRSRFIALAAPAETEEAARGIIESMARQYHDSRHVCHGWRLGHAPATVESRSDAGEPSGTAGEPILVALRKLDLVNVVAVVVRYFGGVKLGTGGLQRAYGAAAEAALDGAPIREVLLGRTFTATFPYSFQKTIGHLLEGSRGKVTAEQYSDQVLWEIWLPHSTWEGFSAALTEASAGTVSLEPREK